MRRLATSTVSYTYRDSKQAAQEVAGQPVYVAPNSIYRSSDIWPAGGNACDKDVALYVGRLENEKKPELIIQALALLHEEYPAIRVRLVGAGSQKHNLESLAKHLGVNESVTFDGWIDQVETLRNIYSTAFCSLSPGFAGLGLTQSLGFGVPMIVSRDEPHSPEIELAEGDAVQWFASDDADSLATAMKDAWLRRGRLPLEGLSESVRSRYSAEAMATGLITAIEQTLRGRAPLKNETLSRSVIPTSVVRSVRALLRTLSVRGPVEIGRNFRIGLGARIHATHGLWIGDDVAIGPGSAVQVNGTIGNFVMMGMQVQVIGKNDHSFDEPCQPMRYSTWIGDRALTARDKIRIEDDVWIGASSVILSGITIGEGAIVAAGSVVTNDVKPYSIIAGNPAKEVRKRFTNEIDEGLHRTYLQSKRKSSPSDK